ncbi:MAG: hydroxysqualene dehydroxylase HpnE [Rhodospirillales bacterium]|nr:hydroxysqualene dehydroxylase HpnE [Rhodospirillales bacterium]
MIHVVGAGLAGLSAATSLAARGIAVALHEAGPAAGGRCRSYFDRELGCRIDNGNHLLLSGNRAAMAYLSRIGARDSLAGPGRPLFPFYDAASGESWILRPSPGRIPWWVLRAGRRVPGTRLGEYRQLLALRRARGSVAEALDPASPLYRRLLEPLAVAALNTRPDTALASLLGAVVAETLLRGGAACTPLVPREGLSESFIDPAIAWLAARGCVLHTSRRVAGLAAAAGRVTALRTAEGEIALGPDDAAILAVPPWVATALLPGLVVPDAFEAILNLHFRVQADPGPACFIGVVGATAEWIFIKPGIVSVTISAANHLVDLPAEELAARVWPEVCAALKLPAAMPSPAMPPWRVVKEKRATFAATAAQEIRRPGPRAPEAMLALANLVLAGDWTATGLPATIEGAIRSGSRAAEAILPG